MRDRAVSAHGALRSPTGWTPTDALSHAECDCETTEVGAHPVRDRTVSVAGVPRSPTKVGPYRLARDRVATDPPPRVSEATERVRSRRTPGRRDRVDIQHTLVPLALFLCVTYAFKAVLDAVMRERLLKERASEETIDLILAGERAQRRLAALRSGILLVSIAAGFGLVQWIGWQEINAGVVAVLVGATGVGHLVFYALARRRP